MHEIISPSVSTSEPTDWEFRKIYDGSPNVLGGTCQLGQLMQEGFDQAREIGALLKDHYFKSHGDIPPLLESSRWKDLDSKRIYMRSDDEGKLKGNFLMNFATIYFISMMILCIFILFLCRSNSFDCPDSRIVVVRDR